MLLTERDKKFNSKLKQYLTDMMVKTRQYASYQLKTTRMMRLRNPRSTFVIECEGDG